MKSSLSSLAPGVRQYMLVTGNYWAFTLTDGALRMLVVLYFYGLGYSPLEIAMLFIFYEVFGVITNLIGGWLGARLGLNKTMNIGLFIQIVALSMLLVPSSLLSIPWVMMAQALSGIAKDLNKMSAKSAIKTLVPSNAQGQLYTWVALLTGSKNALKGAGFFLGGLLLNLLGFHGALLGMVVALTIVWVFSLFTLGQDIGKAKNKPKFSEIFSKSKALNTLSAARMFLFGARDVWFVIAVPVYLAGALGWSHVGVGTFMACWVIGYGFIQGVAPKITNRRLLRSEQSAKSTRANQDDNDTPDGRDAFVWASVLAFIPLLISLGIDSGWNTSFVLVTGLLIFGVLFAINSSLHSYLVVSYANEDGVSLDVGFYYMANAMGRLIGTVLSGWVFQAYGLAACLIISTAFVVFAAVLSLALPKHGIEVKSAN